ncbi:MAG TPA: tetratricopeptide repeat protein [Bryobacteraceae bacterium]|nr:tetratricopeptide repeat protein [Bryobacteraceae bacterium]
MRLLGIVLAAAALLAAQQTGRDLKLEKDLPPESVPAAPAIPRSYALVIGIGGYQNLPANLQLQFAERDAEAVYSILISREGGNFPAENVRRLVGPKATLANIRRELEEWLPSVAKDDDRVLIYFAGHGFVYGGKGYLAPHDFVIDNVAGTGYPMESLGALIGGKIKAKWKVLLTDSCHSGAITPEENAQLNRSLLDLHRSLFSLTASRDRERSFESPEWGGGHGIFTYYVVKGLEGSADENRDAIVTADELAEYVRRNVREASGGQQNPTSDRGSFDPNMLLAYIPTNAAAGAPPPPKEGALIFEVNMDGVEVFVNGKSAGVVDKGKPLRLPGLAPGAVTVKAVRMGYEPDGPRELMVYPGQESTVTIRITIPRRRNRSAVDLFDDGVEAYNKGFEQNYTRAAALFQKALAIDPKYSQAALYLARTQNALYDEENAAKNFRRAIELDPDYMEARASFAGMLLDVGDADEAIRQLTVVVQRDRKNAMGQYLLAQAFRMKDEYPQSIEAARASIQVNPINAEAHFWLAESLRLSGQFDEARREYASYLKLSDFDSKLAGKLNYYAVGFLIGMGKKKRAAQTDIWKDLRGLAFFGMCDAERKLKNFDTAITYCQRSLSYAQDDPYVHYALALAYMRKAEATGSCEWLPPARKGFQKMIELNENLPEAEFARKNVVNIEAALRTQCP